ncbi:family 10 glycosylhydrolase [Maribellus sp. CM-23]|uniref:alpha amylase family protein n=1 Tax=Maribellus sp. CM-23 TaxID=2781026 RepID=UPI001F417175|nr:alpha amylase family protein [Maribellus sp. CM-23]MCE4565507.1 family 10 glycosylhydrolase [Maribellus sp. CM-23]
MKQMQSFIFWSLMAFMVFSVTSCGGDDSETPEWKWDDGVPNADKPRFIWIDAAANFPDFANSKENILRDLTLAKDAGFTGVVVDVRPTTGDVLFQTNVENQVSWLGAWLPGGYTKIERTATWDYLQAFIDAGHSLGLEVYAGVNTFSGGNTTSIGSEGMLFRNSARKEWATSLLTGNGIVNTLDQNTSGAKFFNPVNEDVQNYLCDMLADLASYENLDGIILDRGRFDGIDSDFSNYTRTKFENYLGHPVTNFPDDVMTPGTAVGSLPNPQPIYLKKWLEFRAKVIHDFMEKARNKVKAVNPEIQFGVYVGGWYGSYYGVGVNWASPRYNVSSSYSLWATSEYKNYGYADQMDIIIIGAYAAPTRILGSTEWTVQGFCSLAADKIKGDALVIGGPDVGNGDWATSSNDITGQAIIQSVDAAMSACDGYFLFDMIHLKQKSQWDYVKDGIDAAISE